MWTRTSRRPGSPSRTICPREGLPLATGAADPYLVARPVELEPGSRLPDAPSVPEGTGQQREADGRIDVRHRPGRRRGNLAPRLRFVECAAGESAPVGDIGGELEGVVVTLAFPAKRVVRHDNAVVDPVLGGAAADVDHGRAR